MAVSISYNADLKKARGEPILAAIYARYSSHSQTEQSIEGQLAAAHAYAESHGYTVVHEYCDRAQTGRNDNRDAFQQMLSDTDKHQFDVIITWKVDRIGRNREDIAFNKHRCKKNGIRIEYVAENLPDSAESVILESVLEGMAEYYSLQLSTNIRRGQLESARKLQCIGGTRPLGYDVDRETKRFIINPQTAPIVKQIFERYAKGSTETEIITWLNEQGIRTTKKKPFSKSSLATLLHNEKYIGVYAYKDIVRVEDGVPAIVDKDLFDKVQELMKVNRRAPSHTWTHQDYILTDKLFCGKCGSPMVGESGFSHTGAKHSYYSCVGHRKKKICDKRPVRQDWIEKKVLEATRDLLADEELLDYVADKTYAYYLSVNGNAEQKTVLENELVSVNTSIDRLISAIEAGAFNDRIKTRLDDLNAQKAQITASIAEMELASGFRLTRDHIAFFLRQFRDADLNDRACQKRLVQTFVNSVFVYDDKIKIVYNYASDSNTVTLDTVENLDVADGSGFVHSAGCSTIAIRYEPGIIIFGAVFMIIIETGRDA
jgi:DNA invertase Pin-like site-specific DNA recombinase